MENIYQQNGFANRRDYLKSLAADFCVEFENVVALANALGPNEDFDGLVTMIEDFLEC